jgi:single-strand DNA-binding protein
MAGSINKVILIGKLGGDPETRGTQAGERVVSFSLATSESWRDRESGERRERTEWHHIAIFNKQLAEVAFSYLRRGSKVYLEGQLRTRHWEDHHGQPRSTTEVVLSEYRGKLVMLDSRQDNIGAPVSTFDLALGRVPRTNIPHCFSAREWP